MGGAPDWICCVVLVCLTAAVGFAHRVSAKASVTPTRANVHHAAGLAGTAAGRALLWALGPLVRTLVAAGVSANAVTATSLAFGVGAGALLCWGHFGVAAV